MPDGDVIYLLTSYTAILSCFILSKITHVPTRKVYSIIVGFSLGFYIFGLPYGWNVINISVNYLLMLLLPRNYAAGAILTFSFSTLMVVMYYHCNFFDERPKRDINFVFMLNYIKLHMLAVNYYNAGFLDNKDKVK